MTLLEKAKEMGMIAPECKSGADIPNCPYHLGLETIHESNERCSDIDCQTCFEREYKGPVTTTTIKDSGNRTPLGNTGFVRDCQDSKGRMDLLPWHAIMEVSVHCEEGAKKYGERNIDKGAPLHSLLSSGARHLAKYILGHHDEDHLRAACWNLLWALEQRTTHPECNDMPWAKEANDVSEC